MKPHKLMCLALGVLFLAACAPTKLPPIPIQDSKWCEAETCDAVLYLTVFMVGPNGRSTGEPLVMRLRMPMARCQAELDHPVHRYSGPVNIPGYSRASSAWCESALTNGRGEN